MDISKAVNYKIENVIDVMLKKGVQPEELAENIWDEKFFSIKIEKNNGNITCCIKFSESHCEIQMNYIYNNEKELIKIEEFSMGLKSVLWDREDFIRTNIEDICNLLRTQYSFKEIETFIDSLPKSIKKLLEKQLKEIA